MSELHRVIHERVLARKRELMSSPTGELRALPLCTQEEFAARGKRQQLSVWHDKTGKGEDIVIVQCKRDLFLGFGFMFAEGFVFDENGRMRDAEEELMWEYR